MILFTAISREDARLRPPQRPIRAGHPSQGVVVHCTGGREALSYAHACSRWRITQATHFGNGWADLGYSYGFNDLGHILEGRGWDLECAAGPPHNRTMRHICYQGSGRHPSELALEAMAWLVEEHDRLFGRGLVYGHRDFSRKECPGDGVYAALLERWGDRR